MTILHALTSYSGRMSPSEYWIKGMLPLFLATLPLAGVLTFFFGPPLIVEGWSVALSMALLSFDLPLCVKRAHDRNHSAWFLLILLIPVIGWLWLFIELGFVRGTQGANRFDAESNVADVRSGGGYRISASTAVGFLIVLLSVASLTVFTGLFPSLCMRYADFGAKLPDLTQLIVNTADLFSGRGMGGSIGGLMLGFWIWMCLRAVRMIACDNAASWSQRLLWTSSVLGVLLNLLVGFAYFLPLFMLNRVVTL